MRRLLAGCACLLIAFALATPAQAKASDDRVVVEGPVTIGPREVVGDVVVVHGDVTVAGRLTGDLVVVSGKLRLNGSVHGDVASIADRAALGPRARVGGDVLYGDEKPVVAPGARVDGDVKRVNFDKATGGLGLAVGFGIWLAITVSALLLGVLLLWVFPRAAAAVYEVAESRLGAAIGFGLLTFVATPIVGVILLVTLLGLPLGVLLLLALAPFYALGYTASAWALGRRILGPAANRFVAFLAGLAILRVVSLVPIVNGLIWFAATVFGLGLIVLAVSRARSSGAAAPPPAPGPAPAG